MRRLVLVLLLAGCPPRPVPPTPMLDARPLPETPACPVPAVALSADVCIGWFDADGRACVRCRNELSCVDLDLQIRCTSGACALDPQCAQEH